MRYICIHGHFYQPPRENPWIEAIERQQSAHPFHDWNERINAECYSPNAASRILDEEKQIVRIVNNYSKISFNFGPTLFSWIEQNDPDVYRAILEADVESRKNHSGHGSALAQAYHHMILPLANEADKYTQVLWGIRDFEYRFGREPEGMWLPESAVDTPTLEVLAQLGVKFTILAPNQAARVRKLGERKWTSVSDSRIDPTSATLLRLPSGRSISLFFYDGPLSRAVAFEGLLGNGERFAKRLLGTFPQDNRECPPLVHIATDGETYGHHHRYGEMALSYALNYIEANHLAELTNYGEYLERHPPDRVVEIFENSSWSCIHGVERWRSNCGCNSGGHSDWNQQWRAPLRQALNWLRDSLIPVFESNSLELLAKPWAARNDYIDVILDRSADNFERFLDKHAVRPLNEADKATVWKLMELQRHAMMMYTSCGWFFDEISGIETVQVLQYAGRALQLAEELGGAKLEGRFVDLLRKAKSNIPEMQDGAAIFAKLVKPAFADSRKVSVPYSIWRGRALAEGNLAARARRSSRLAIRVPVQISSLEIAENSELFAAWTVVVNKNGARLECNRAFRINEEVRISDPATGKKASGKIIWVTPLADEDGNYEFAVGLHNPTNLWNVNVPPHDWEALETSAGAESLVPPWEEASDSADQLVPEPRVVERTSATPPLNAAASTQDVIPATSGAPASTSIVAPPGKSPIGFHSPDSPPTAPAATSTPLGRIDLSVKPPSASDWRDAAIAAPDLQPAASREEGQNQSADAVTVEAVAKDAITQDALDSVEPSAALQLPVLQEQILELCRSQIREMLTSTMHNVRREISSRIEEIGRKVERMADRAEETLILSVGQLETTVAKTLAESTTRMEAQIAQSAKAILSDIAPQILTEIAARDARLPAQPAHDIGSPPSSKSLAESRVRIMRSLREVAKTIEPEQQEDR